MTPDSHTSCDVCRNILKAFTIPSEEFYRSSLGPISSVIPLVATCLDHETLLRGSFLDYNLNSRSQRLQRTATDISTYGRTVEVAKSENNTSISFAITNQEDSDYLHLSKDLVFRAGIEDHPGTALILDSNFIDLQQILRWTSSCQENHLRCKDRGGHMQQHKSRPRFLIDTVDECLVSGEEKSDYVTLSYCWGVREPPKEPWFRNLRDISEELAVKGALSRDSTYGVQIAKTIRDSIRLVPRLGQRYLWVDSLCIVQDDLDMKGAELPKMTDIYANSCLTIVAAEGENADVGLPGLDFTRPRHMDQECVNLGEDKLITPINYAAELGNTSFYHSRGWTFQEFTFSKRRLIFEQESVRWECKESDFHEDIVVNLLSDEDEDDLYVLRSKGPDIDMFNYVINKYNGRDLTYHEDALPAFSGLQKTLSQSWPFGFLYGMPVYYFDFAMAWKPWTQSVYRRQSSQPTLDPPTWTWLGWQGIVNMTYHTNELDSPLHNVRLEKLVDWYAMQDLTSPKTSIQDYNQQRSDEWSLVSEPKYLFCRAERAMFRFHGPLFADKLEQSLNGAWYCLVNPDGQWSGVLRFHDEADVSEISEGEELELVAISTGWAPGEEPEHLSYGLTEWHAKERNKETGKYCFYNVLCITWKDGVAHRICSGRIAKDEWERANREEIDLILG